MDSFDDLLSTGRNALEDNPFADPFARRSNSPDPWATPFASSLADDAFTNGANYSETSETHESTSISPTTAHDVLNPPEDADDFTTSQQFPGFRESIEPAVSSQFKGQEDSEPLGIAAAESASLPVPSSVDTKNTPSPPFSSSQDTSRPPTTPSHIVVSPSTSSSASHISNDAGLQVDRVAQVGTLHQSLAELSLGTAPTGVGWQPERSAWVGQIDDDSDDDKPIGRVLKLPEMNEDKPCGSSFPRTDQDAGVPPAFVISVEDPQKLSYPIGSFTMYTVHTRTTSPLFKKSAFAVLRRYSDFLWLYETLSTNNPGVVVPPVPEKNPFRRFDDQFVRQRRFALEKCIQKIANHPILGQDSDLRMFLESDTFPLDIKHRKVEISHERGGVLASIGQVVAGARFHETDEWFERQRSYLDSLESQLRGLVKAIESVARQRAENALAIGELAQALNELSQADVGKQVSQSLAGLAEVEKGAEEIQNAQSEQDMVTFMGTVDEYARLINSVRLAFNSRIRTYHNWKAAESDLLRIKQNHEKNRVQGRIPPDRLGYSLSQVAEAERRASEGKHEYEHVSKLVKSEVARFEEERVQDFKDSLHAFLEGMISKQKEVIGRWEAYQQILLRKAGTCNSDT